MRVRVAALSKQRSHEGRPLRSMTASVEGSCEHDRRQRFTPVVARIFQFAKSSARRSRRRRSKAGGARALVASGYRASQSRERTSCQTFAPCVVKCASVRTACLHFLLLRRTDVSHDSRLESAKGRAHQSPTRNRSAKQVRQKNVSLSFASLLASGCG